MCAYAALRWMSRVLFQVRYALSKMGRSFNLKQQVAGKGPNKK